MNQSQEKYYILFPKWSLDPNQWSMVMDGTAVILTLLGFIIAFWLYKVQREDKATDAHRFFIASLPELKTSITHAIKDLNEFKESLDLDKVVDPVLSVSLNDKFLEKVNLVALNRYYAKNDKANLERFNKLLVDSNFFGDYRDYITNQIKYFRSIYLEREEDHSGDISQMKNKIRDVLDNDISRFEEILENIDLLLEEPPQK
ncbi:hypothetical protein [Christiangramia echinicola]|uniref:hypothetical protein n=1 Tax=Christiangramia echinicola TaxID=279359 RepID=UPI00047E2A31|nr:hypothetical protein [Christiangramia echinicola]